jgi:two-component sensor histidine kinase
MEWAHLIACLAAVALAGSLIFFDAREHELRTWHLFPLLVWAALAFRVDGAGPAVAITCMQAIFSAIMGLGPLSETGDSAPERLLFAQQFVAAMGVTILMMAAISDERRGTERLTRTAKALAEEREALATLNESGAAIAAELDLDKVVQQVTDAGVTLSGARFGAFFYNVADQAGERLTLFTLSGAPREAFERFGHPRNTPVFAPTFNGEGVVRSEDITKDPRYGQFSPHHGMPKGHLPVRSYLAVPVRSRSGEVIGGLFFGHPDPGVFTERSEQLLEGLAGQAAIALDNARLFQAAQWEIERRRRGEEHQRLLINELNHRVKNTLATVQSIAAQTLRSEGDPEAVREAFTARLMALSTAHDVLTRESWEGAELAQIVASAIRPFEGVRGRFVIDGPAVWLEPKSALAIAMALHELGVNAVKYGALTAEGGRVELSWRIPEADQLHLTWREAGGPSVTPPARAGFGSRLIQRGLAGELGGHAEIRFEPSGVVCEITAALGRPVAPSPAREDVFAR